VTAASQQVADLLDNAVVAYLGARADTRDQVRAVLARDPLCAMAHCLDGYLSMLASKEESRQDARRALARASDAASRVRATPRESLHIAALDAWSQGDLHAAVRHWDALLADHPRDVVAVRVSQFVLSYLGESARMRDTVMKVLPSWDSSIPGYGFMLGCHAYALEECGEYALAEEMGQRAVELNPTDIWAAHAVAHVREMEGRLQDGVAWITSLADQWRDCGNFAFHLRWHEGLYYLELDEHARVLELYDRQVRPRSTDEYLDLANAVSLLWRLEQAEVDVGQRWEELAARARAHTDDHALVFVDLHYLMALAAARDDASVARFLDSCERFARSGAGTEARVMAEVGLPLARAVVAHRRGRTGYGDVVDALLPVRHRVREIGASHAQRDLFEQLLIDAAWRARRLDVAESLLAERMARRPRNIWGWKHYAAVLEARGASAATGARRELARVRGW
jgi:tetratricopeptide (TPR) repeat protein